MNEHQKCFPPFLPLPGPSVIQVIAPFKRKKRSIHILFVAFPSLSPSLPPSFLSLALSLPPSFPPLGQSSVGCGVTRKSLSHPLCYRTMRLELTHQGAGTEASIPHSAPWVFGPPGSPVLQHTHPAHPSWPSALSCWRLHSQNLPSVNDNGIK